MVSILFGLKSWLKEEAESDESIDQEQPADSYITATEIGKHFDLSANKMNFILSELGLAKKGGELKGWVLTDCGTGCWWYSKSGTTNRSTFC